MNNHRNFSSKTQMIKSIIIIIIIIIIISNQSQWNGQ